MGAAPAFADGPLPKDTKPAKSRKSEVLATAAAQNLYKDPRGRFVIRHSNDWKLIVNWGGMPQPFCQFEPCRSTPLATCEFSYVQDKELKGLDPGLLTLAFPAMKESIDIGLLGKVKGVEQGYRRRKLGTLEWQRFQFDLDLLNVKEFAASMWFGVSDDRFVMFQCQAPKGSVPNLVKKAEALLAGLELTKP